MSTNYNIIPVTEKSKNFFSDSCQISEPSEVNLHLTKDIKSFVKSTTFQKLSGDAVKLFMYLTSFKSFDKNYVFPRQAIISEVLGCQYRKLKKLIQELINAGLIQYQSGSGRLNSEYTFTNEWDKQPFKPSVQRAKEPIMFKKTGQPLQNGESESLQNVHTPTTNLYNTRLEYKSTIHKPAAAASEPTVKVDQSD